MTTYPSDTSNVGSVFDVTGWLGRPLGFRFGRDNRQIYVNPDWPTILIKIDEKVCEIKVTDSFWNDCPEVRDTAIEKWLVRHGLAPWPHSQSPTIKMRCLGGRRFEVIDPRLYAKASK